MIHSFFAGMIFMAISIFMVRVGARKIAIFRRRETLMQVIIFLIFGIIWVGIANAADLPHYADLTFTDIPDLDARVDSALAICDSALTKVQVDSLMAEGWDVYNPVIYRQWAGLTMFDMPKVRIVTGLIDAKTGSVVSDTVPGKARLWWWEVER